MYQWLLIITSAFIFMIIGYNLNGYTQQDWKLLLSGDIPANNRMVSFGGFMGLIFGGVLAKYLLGFRKPVLDTMAIILPVGMAVQRIGCLLAGCCYGKPANLPWGIAYGDHAPAYHKHLQSGFIHAGEPTSLLVHPTQVYQIILCLLIVCCISVQRKRSTSVRVLTDNHRASRLNLRFIPTDFGVRSNLVQSRYLLLRM